MDVTLKVTGLREAQRALMAAFPSEPKKQRALLNQSMSAAAKKTFVPMAKALAMQGDGSGALSQSIGVRSLSLSRTIARGRAAMVQVTPVRNDKTAIAMYTQFYRDLHGRKAGLRAVIDGIRHGHLIEFGFTSRGNTFSGRPFLGPAAVSQRSPYTSLFARSVRRKIELAVKRARRKARG